MIKRNKILLACLVGILFFGVGIYSIGRILTYRVNTFVFNLAEKLSQQVGHPVTFSKVTSSWDWMYLKIQIQDLTILDSATETPIFMASSIVSTVDTISSILDLSLKFKQMLLVSPRLVIQWDGIEPPTVLGLGGEDIPGRIDPSVLLQLLSMQHRVTIENGDIHIQGRGKADLPFMSVKVDFVEKAKQEYNIVVRGSIAAATPPEFNFAMNYHGNLDDITHALIEFEFKTSNMQVDQLLNFLPQYDSKYMRGDFKEFDVKGTIQNGKVGIAQTNFVINNLEINDGLIIADGEGEINVKSNQEKLSFNIHHLKIIDKRLFSYPINIDKIQADLSSIIQDQKWTIQTDNLIVNLLDMQLQANLAVDIGAEAVERLDFTADLQDGEVRKALILLPDNRLPTGLTRWMKKSLLDGVISRVAYNYENSKSHFAVDFKNTEVKYSAEWPSIHGMNANLVMNDGVLRIDASQADMQGNKIDILYADFSTIRDKPNAMVQIYGKMSTTLEIGQDFIARTPLQTDLGAKVAAFKPTGNILLDINLNVDTSGPEPINTVKGEVTLNQDTVFLPDLNLNLTEISGKLNFSNNGVSAKNLDLKIFGQPAIASISLDENKGKGLQVNVQSLFEAKSINQIFPDLNFDKINGMTKLSIEMELPWYKYNNEKTLSISSDLVGIALDYPEPLHKDAKAKWPLQLKYNINAANNGSIQFKLTHILDGKLFLKKQKLSGARISIGEKATSTAATESILINGRMQVLDWDVWQEYLPIADKKQAIPLDVQLFIEKLIFHDTVYPAITVKYNTQAKELFVNNKTITGSIFLNEDNKIDVKLDNLELRTDSMNKNELVDYLKERNAQKLLPTIDFACDNLKVGERQFEKVNLALLPRTYGYEIKNFSIMNDSILLEGQGQWKFDATDLTQFSGNAYTNNFGKVLTEWVNNTSMSKGKGEINFNLQWSGNPTQFDVLNIEGALHIDLRSGSFIGVNPGLGRIIGLLNIDSLQKRLKLDFSDVVSKGFVFDKFIADVKLTPGYMASDNITINSPSARIELTGKAGIKSRELDFIMNVTPKTGAGLPVAAALAVGNPAIGGAVGAMIWLFDQASGSKISEMNKYKYKVTGTWDSPKIDEITADKNEVKREEQGEKKQ